MPGRTLRGKVTTRWLGPARREVAVALEGIMHQV